LGYQIEKNEMSGGRSMYGEKRCVYRVMMGKPRVGDHLEDPGRIILRWIFRKWDVGTWNGSIWLRIGTGGRHL
jgi:hypothetical protein